MSTCPVQLVLLLQLVLLVQLVLFTSRTTLLPLLLVLLQLHVSRIGDLPINDHRPSPMCCWVLNQCSRVHFQLRRVVYVQWWCIYNGGVYTMVVYAPMSALMYTSNYGLYISMSYISIYTAANTSNFNGNMDSTQQYCSIVLMCTSGSKHLSACSTSGSEHLSVCSTARSITATWGEVVHLS